MPVGAYIIFAIVAFLSFVFGAFFMSRRIRDMKIFGDLYINGSDLYLDGNPELLAQPDGQYVVFRIVRVTDESRENQGL